MVSYPSYNNNRLANGIDSSDYASLNTDLSSPMLNRATQSRTAPDLHLSQFLPQQF